MNDLKNTPISFSVVSENNLSSLFTHGDDKFDGTKNRKTLMSSIRFIKGFTENLMNNVGDNLAASKVTVLHLPPYLCLDCLFFCFVFVLTEKGLFHFLRELVL